MISSYFTCFEAFMKVIFRKTLLIIITEAVISHFHHFPCCPRLTQVTPVLDIIEGRKNALSLLISEMGFKDKVPKSHPHGRYRLAIQHSQFTVLRICRRSHIDIGSTELIPIRIHPGTVPKISYLPPSEKNIKVNLIVGESYRLDQPVLVEENLECVFAD